MVAARGKAEHAKLGIRHLKIIYGQRTSNGKMLNMLPWIGFLGRNLLPYALRRKGTNNDDDEPNLNYTDSVKF